MVFDGNIIIFENLGINIIRMKGSQRGKVQLYQIHFNGGLSMTSGEGFCFDIQ